MGKRNRERIAAIESGHAVSISDARDILAAEVARLAAPLVFQSGFDHPEAKFGTEHETIAAAIGKVLPQALDNTGIKMFTVYDLSRRKDWLQHCSHLIHGVMATCEKEFAMAGKETFRIKKRIGRKRMGTWRFCLYCGEAFYARKSSTQRWHTLKCYFADKAKTRKLAIIKTRDC